MPEISIIIPIYNSEKYLSRCINSILNQKFTDFELILIDDGSIDNSYGICEEYRKSDYRIILKHTENLGVSAARNLGLKIASGKYIMFSDSDDYVSENWCYDLYHLIMKDCNSLGICGFKIINYHNNTEVIKIFIKGNAKINKSEYFKLYEKSMSGSLWNKIYINEIIIKNQIVFDEKNNRGEDLLFNLNYIKYINNICSIDQVNYFYCKESDNSLISCYRKNLFDYIVLEYNAWLKYFHKNQVNAPELCRSFYTSFFHRFIYEGIQNTFNEKNKDNLAKKLKYCNSIINTKEFQECLNNGEWHKEDFKYIKVLKTKNYYLVWLFEKIIHLKHRLERLI